MKKLIYGISLLLALSACEVVVVEPYDPRERIIGDWEIEEYSQTFDEIYLFPITISRFGGDGESVRIHNFYDSNLSVRAYLVGNKIQIPFQVVDFYEISGVGTIHGDEITFNYAVYDQIYGGLTDHCVATAW